MEILLVLLLLGMIIVFVNQSSKLKSFEDELRKISRQLEKISKRLESREEPIAKSGTVVTPVLPQEPPVPAPPPEIIPPVYETPVATEPELKQEKAEDDLSEKILKLYEVSGVAGPEKQDEESIPEPLLHKPIEKQENAGPPSVADTTPEPETKQAARVESVPRDVYEPDWYTNFRQQNPDLEKFIGENILSKVAIGILVIGVAFFVKYAIDKDWINEAARAGIGMLCGGVVMGIAHRLHKRFKAFSSVLVGGALSIFYFTVGISFHQYHLISQTVAFIIMLVITAFSVFVSVAYDRRELAALSIIGGFATPFILSTGEGNYKILFTYILILDSGMLVLAYLRKWNIINILSYCFTILLYMIWLDTKVMGKPDGPFEGAFLFGGLFYVLFFLMNIVNNIKERRSFDSFELGILLSNTFVFFAEGMRLLTVFRPELRGLFSVGLALINMMFAFLLYKKYKADLKLVYLLIGLTLTFITVAAPIQLEGNYIALFWSLEGVLLMWLSQKSRMALYRFGSAIVTIISLLAVIYNWINIYTSTSYPWVIIPVLLNKAFITAAVAVASLYAVRWLLRRETFLSETEKAPHEFMKMKFEPVHYNAFLSVALLVFLYFAGMLEYCYQYNSRFDGKNTFYILLGCYHFLFMAVLNMRAIDAKNSRVISWLLSFNLISLFIYLFIFAVLPSSNNVNTAGFLFHYVSLAASVFIALRSYWLLSEVNKERRETYFNPVIIAVAVTYVCSLELVLHIVWFAVPHLGTSNSDDFFAQRDMFDKTLTQVVKIGFPILWGVLSFIFLTIGLRLQNKLYRISGLGLIAITVLKLFVYDIQNASEGGKIAAFIILGIVLLIISFRYQKIKALLKDDETDKETENKN